MATAVCLAGIVLAWLRPPTEELAEPVPRLSEPARALLGGLGAGDALVGWTVRSLEGPTDGMLRVDLERDEVRFALMVAPKDSRPERPPVTTERYVIFYGHVHPPGLTLPTGTIRATTHALARRVRAHETEVEVPGMTDARP